MKTLYLVRHAKSSWKQPELDDFDRPLNKRGKRDAPQIAKRLAKLKIFPEIIISSPAQRAAETARIITEKIGFPEKKIQWDPSVYEAGVEALLDVIHRIPESANAAMMFGHNPGITILANFLGNTDIVNIPTCGVYCVRFKSGKWRDVRGGSGECCFYEYPKKPVEQTS